MSVLNRPHFHSEPDAFAHLEGVLWPDGPVCPHCGSVSKSHYDLRKTRVGLRKCKDCRKQFTVKVGTVFESAHIPLHKMLQAVYLMSASKKGVSAHQIHRTLGITYKSAWFLCHRIREAMRDGSLAPLGGNGKTVEIDETIIGRQEGSPPRKGLNGSQFRNIVLTLVERGGIARSFHIGGTTLGTLLPIIRGNLANETAVMTDEASWYRNLKVNCDIVSHDAVHHAAKEYARYEGERVISTNTVEGYYSIFKRGMKGVYQHCGERHLHRYLAEYDFRYSNRVALGCDDTMRADRALAGIRGKRLTYRQPGDV
jgi:transposase-like protein